MLWLWRPDNYQAFPLIGTVNKDTEEIAQDSTYIYMGDFETM